jgi:acyl carrier protein
MLNMQDLKYELKKQIIGELNLQDIKPEDIVDEAPLFGDGLGLDSIDALELVVLMEKYHGVLQTKLLEKKCFIPLIQWPNILWKKTKKASENICNRNWGCKCNWFKC